MCAGTRSSNIRSLLLLSRFSQKNWKLSSFVLLAAKKASLTVGRNLLGGADFRVKEVPKDIHNLTDYLCI